MAGTHPRRYQSAVHTMQKGFNKKKKEEEEEERKGTSYQY
jgi:hypothetical protein